MRETMSEVYDRMTAETAEEDADRQADREYLGSLSEEEFAKETRRRLEAIWDKHQGEMAVIKAKVFRKNKVLMGLEVSFSEN